MRNAMLAILALSAATVATVAGSSPAAAYDYPYCLQGRGIGIPGDCSYSTYAQCMASASGRGALLQRQSARCLRTAAADAGLSGLLIGLANSSRDGRTDARKLFALNDPAIRTSVVTALKYVMQARA